MTHYNVLDHNEVPIKTLLKINRPCEIDRVLLPLGQSFWDYGQHTKSKLVMLTVLSGALVVTEIHGKESIHLSCGDSFVIRSVDVLKKIMAVEESKVLMIKEIVLEDLNESKSLNQEALSTIEQRALEKRITYAIMTYHPLNENDVTELYYVMLRKMPFHGDFENRLQEMFYHIINELPLEPMKISALYCAKLCKDWILNESDLEKAFLDVIHFLRRIYHLIFMPEHQEPLVRNVVYWTLLRTDEVKTAQFISEKLYVNRTYLSGKFKAITGYSLSEYLTNVKMFGAMLLILDPKLNLADVLDILGYKDENHFNKNFKKYLGLSPQAFVKQIQSYNHPNFKTNTKLTKFDK